MAGLKERREQRWASLLGTIGANPTMPVTSPATDLTDPDTPPLRMPDPGDTVRRELLKSLTMRRLRGGRQATILSPALRSLMGTSRTAAAGY